MNRVNSGSKVLELEVPPIRRVAALFISVLVAAAFAAVLPHTQAPTRFDTPSFLSSLLGRPVPASSTPLNVAPGAHLSLGTGSYSLSSRQGNISLSATGAGSAEWSRFANGASRKTPFGIETVTVSASQAEESLVVDSHQGLKTWSWKLVTGGLVPRLDNSGTVGFLDGRTLAGIYIKPVQILNSAGRDITPVGTHWAVAHRTGSWWLALRLDDSHLPTPYVIDPGIVVRSATGSDTAGNPVTAVVLTKPVGVVSNDFLVAQVTFGSSGGSTVITPPAGWTPIQRDDASTISQALFYRVAGGSEPASYTWTLDSAQVASGGIIDSVGVDNSSPIDVTSADSDTTGLSVAAAAPAVTTTAANDLLVGFFGIDGAATFTPPAGLAEEWDTNSGSSPSSESVQAIQASTGSSGTVTATADSAGNWVAQLIALNADVTNPTGSLTAPTTGVTVSGSAVPVSSNSADGESGVASATFERSPAGAGSWTTIGTDATSPYSVAWDSTGVADGLYDLRVVTTDNAGNAFPSPLATNVLVDNTFPTGSLTAPANGAVVHGTIAVSSDSVDAGSGSGSGVASAQFEKSPAGAGTWTNIGASDTTGPYSASWDTSAGTDGLYDLRVVTTDNAGNAFNSPAVTNVKVDNTAPTGSVTAPVSSAIVAGSAVTVSSNSADAGGSGVASARFQRSLAGAGIWTNIGAADTTAPYSVSWDTTGVADGLYDLQVITTDNEGNSFTSAAVTNVGVNNSSPTGAITTPASGANVAGIAVTVSSDSADTPSGVASALFQSSPSGLNTWTAIGVADTTGPYSVSWDTTALTDGQYDLRVITTNNLSTTWTSAPVTVRVDNTLSTGSITTPAAGSTVWGTKLRISSNSADVGGSGVASARFQRAPKGGTWKNISAPDTTAPYRTNWNDTKLAAGRYDLRVITVDKAGNSFTSATVRVVVPKPLKFAMGKVRVIAKGTTSHLTETMKPSAKVKISVTLFLGKKVVHRWHLAMKAGRHTASLAIGTSKLKVGSYKLAATATSADTQSRKRATIFRVLPKPQPKPKPKPTF